MSNDPASLNVTMGFTGLLITDLNVLLNNAPHNSSLLIDVLYSGLGSKRYQVQISGLSIQGAATLSQALLEHLVAFQDTE